VSQSVVGVLIPQDVHKVVRLESNARFILLVEKDAAFQKLLDEGILERLGPCLLITVSALLSVRKIQLKCGARNRCEFATSQFGCSCFYQVASEHTEQPPFISRPLL
jgi:hypothetical protein